MAHKSVRPELSRGAVRPELLPLARANLSRVEALFTDVDGTLTTRGQLRSDVLRAVERLQAAGLRTVLVTGRPAGFAETWLRTLPVSAVIAENGGLYFTWTARHRLKKVYARPRAQLAQDRARLTREVRRTLKAFPGLRLSTDSQYTEVDLALDHGEEAELGSAAAERIVQYLRARGLQAVRSSVHVNTWLGAFDKAWMVRRFLAREWSTALAKNDARFVYVGDSLNDAPLFAAFPLSVGVANVREVLHELDARPRYVTKSAEGQGFVELARAILRARSKSR